MTKQDALNRLSTLEKEIQELKEIINQPDKPTKEQRFFEMINGLTLRFDFEKRPNSVFLFSGDEVQIEYNLKNGYLRIRYSPMWSVFEKEYGLKDTEIQKFIKIMVEKRFKLQGVTPIMFAFLDRDGWRSVSNYREKQINYDKTIK